MSKYLNLIESTVIESAKTLSREKHKYKDKDSVLDWKSPGAKLNVKEHLKFLQDVEKENNKKTP